MSVSARGLFRATGKVAKAGDKPREEHDFYPTPREPTVALLRAERERLRSFGLIWEPAAGDGAMVREIVQEGFLVVGSDLIDRGAGYLIDDFYAYGRSPHGTRAIITNPPFKECHGDAPWVRHALEKLDIDYMALLLPWNWPGAAERAVTWHRLPPARVYLMRWRIDFSGEGASPVLNAWFVWDRSATGPTELLMLDRPELDQLHLLEGGVA